MKPKPIIMQAESVRAILAGRKTQTRRVVKPQPHPDTEAMRDIPRTNRWYAASMEMTPPGVEYRPLGSDRQHDWRSRYQPGDLLWVRETHDINPALAASMREGAARRHVRYAATGDEPWNAWRSAIHMPRWASRIALEVVDVRAERLQDITEADAKAEGVHPEGIDVGGDCLSPIIAPSHRLGYETLWNRINAKRGYPWASDPWVWVYTFRLRDELLESEA